MQPARIEFLTALLRGWHGKCPRCGAGTLFSSFLKMRSHCPACDLALEPYRADDAPAYFTILAVGHIISGIALCITIIGIPFGIANFKLAIVAIAPLGKDIVSTHDPRALGYVS